MTLARPEAKFIGVKAGHISASRREMPKEKQRVHFIET
jgi:hypothetical protein